MSFKSVQTQIAAKEHLPTANAGAILASASRNASPAAKKANPKLLRVKGAAGSGGSARPLVRRRRATIRRKQQQPPDGPS